MQGTDYNFSRPAEPNLSPESSEGRASSGGLMHLTLHTSPRSADVWDIDSYDA
jgi:hypothetical protein